MHTVEANPRPEYLIKSISEQGYSLETALADLIDNSISANADKVEILTETTSQPYTLFIADNGLGMSTEKLESSMHFPSVSPEQIRKKNDLGRFGLGMKTASFSQTRRFTVISRKKGSSKFSGYTWDVGYLKDKKSWLMQVNTVEEVNRALKEYRKLSADHLNEYNDFEMNTLIIWQGLYKFEQYLDDKNMKCALNREITMVTSDYLSLVFHRFMQKQQPLHIRINNKQLSPFDPFPDEDDFRSMEYKEKPFNVDNIKMEGFVLPSRSIDEAKRGNSIWTTPNKSLMDMEGIYIYRADRIIIFGGWNGLIKKAPRLQLARLRVEVGNGVDHLLHLNVAKSQVVIPHDLKKGFDRYIDELKLEAEREFYNKGIRKFPTRNKKNRVELFERRASSKGFLLELNTNFPIIESIKDGLSNDKISQLNMLMRMINVKVNNIRKAQENKPFVELQNEDSLSSQDILVSIQKLKKSGFPIDSIKKNILPHIGLDMTTLPEIIKLELLED